MGTRKVHYSENLLISRDDFAALSAGMGARLKELGNVDVIKASAGVVECALSKSQEVGRELRKIQWVDAEDFIEGEMWELQPPFTGDAPNEDSLRKTVLAVEKSAESIEVGEVVQLERMGFFRLDSKKPKMVFIRTD